MQEYDRYKYSIIDIISKIHSRCTGTYESLENIHEQASWLSWRISDGWLTGKSQDSKFEQTLKILAQDVLAEYNAKITDGWFKVENTWIDRDDDVSILPGNQGALVHGCIARAMVYKCKLKEYDCCGEFHAEIYEPFYDESSFPSLDLAKKWCLEELNKK